MASVTVIGPPGSGKSTFCFNFADYLQNQGMKTSIANVNYFCKHIKYKPDYDVRNNKKIRKLYSKYEDSWPKFYAGMLSVLEKDEKISQMRADTTLFFDFSIPLEFLVFFYSHMKPFYSISDRIVLISSENFRTHGGHSTILAASRLLEEVSARHVIPVFNRPGIERPERHRQATLFEMLVSGDPAEPNDVLEINAVERMGFKALANELKL